VEKPFTLAVADAQAAINAAETAGIVLAVGFNRPSRPSMTMLRQAVRSSRTPGAHNPRSHPAVR
jgi:predicted dehydrogenase